MIFRHLLNMRSHPTWVRGLKQMFSAVFYLNSKSHPTWVRGLKQLVEVSLEDVACRTLRGCVD